MKSDRKEVQKWWERKLGCNDLNHWPEYKSRLMSSSLSALDIPLVEKACESDRVSYGINAILSFLEGIESIRSKHFSWGIIQLYYSVFYALRYEILLHDHFLVRCKTLYLMRLKDGAEFKEIKATKKNGDHRLTIKAEKALVDARVIVDPVLDNDIDGISPYLWLMEQRERVNYRQQCFSDPECDGCVIRPYKDYIAVGKCNKLLELYSDDNMLIYLFDKDHSMVSVPYYRISRIFEQLSWNSVNSLTKSHIFSIYQNIDLTIWFDRYNLYPFFTPIDTP